MLKNRNQSLTVHVFGLTAWLIFFVLVVKNPSLATNSQISRRQVRVHGTSQISKTRYSNPS